MTWARLDDDFPEHEKVIDISDRAFRVHVTAICQCAKHLTDGVVGTRLRVVEAIVNKPTKKAVEELLEAGLWFTNSDGEYEIRDFLDYNPSQKQVKSEREKNARRQEKWRDRHRSQEDENPANSEDLSVSTLKSNGVTSTVSNGVTNAVPSRPLEVQVLKDGPNGLVELASSTADVKVVYDYWRVKCGKTRSTYDTISTKRREKIKTRLKEFSVADLCLAIDGVVMDPWGERSQHNDITVVLKSREQVERFLEIASANGNVEAAAYSARLSAFYAEKRGLEVIPGGRIGE